MQSLSQCFYTGLDERLLAGVTGTAAFWPLRAQRCPDIFSKCFTVNEFAALLTSWCLSLGAECVVLSLSSTFGALWLLPHGCCHRLILFFLNSQATPSFLLLLFFYPAVLIFLPFSLTCSFCLSAGAVCSACQWAFTRVPCLLLRGLLCSSAALPIPFVNAHSRGAVCLSFFFFYHFLVKVFVLCFLHLAHFSHWTIFRLKKSIKLDVAI